MPVDTAKEAAKVVVETSSGISSIVSWILNTLAAAAAAVIAAWYAITGRITKLEQERTTAALIKADLDKHKEEESDTFRLLFEKHEQAIAMIHTVANGVARIEGQLSAYNSSSNSRDKD